MKHTEARLAVEAYRRLPTLMRVNPPIEVPPDTPALGTSFDPLWDAIREAVYGEGGSEWVWSAIRSIEHANRDLQHESWDAMHVLRLARVTQAYQSVRDQLGPLHQEGIDCLLATIERTGSASDAEATILSFAVDVSRLANASVWPNLRYALDVCRSPHVFGHTDGHKAFCECFPVDRQWLNGEKAQEAAACSHRDRIFCLNATMLWWHVKKWSLTHKGLHSCLEHVS